MDTSKNLSIMFYLLFLFFTFLKFTSGYYITVDAHSEECFFDRVKSGTKMSLMFEVAEGGFLDIDVIVSISWNYYFKLI